MSVVGALSLWGATQASHELMESVQYVKKKLAIGGAAIGVVLSGIHVGTETTIGVISQFKEKFNQVTGDIAVSTTDYSMQLVMNNNYSHAALMAGALALYGRLGIDKPEHRNTNIAHMMITTSALAAAPLMGDYSWVGGLIGIGAGINYGLWQYKTDVACISCGHSHGESHDKAGYISWSGIKGLAQNVADTPKDALQDLGKGANAVRDKITNFTLPTPRTVLNTTLKLAPLGISTTALSIFGHEMADNAVLVAEQGGANIATLSLLSSIGNVAPEFIAGMVALRMRENAVAGVMIVGCTIFGTGIAGGLQNILGDAFGNDLPSSLDLTTLNGQAILAGMFGSIGAYALMTKDSLARSLNEIEQKAARSFSGKPLGEVTKPGLQDMPISKTAAAFVVAGSIGYAALSTIPICHSHGGEQMHCFDANTEIPNETDLSF